MERQLLKKLKPEIAARELIAVVETATCLECCKFYILPATTICGHTLCHGCWIGRATCPVCARPVKRRTLKANATIKKYTESVQKVVALFEKQYNINLYEYTLQSPVRAIKKIDKDPRKNVDAWLCDSQNHFSAPISSQLSTQADSPVVEVKTCDVQVHIDSKKHASPSKTKLEPPVAPPPVQDDWDKIESVPDTEEFGKNKENVGPMDIEPYYLDDEEYTTDHPRRSSRKQKHEIKPSETSGDKHSSSNLSMDIDKLSRIKQNWSNVKKMRKEFSKLYKKKNKNKLNVSIEMCKKSKSVISKPATSVEAESQKAITIDECTPDVKQDETSLVPDKVPMETNDVQDNDNNKSPAKEFSEDLHFHTVDTNEGDEIKSNKNDCIPGSSSILNNFKDVNNCEKEIQPMETDKTSPAISNIPFFKKSALQMNNPTDVLKNSSQNTERILEDVVNTDTVQKDVVQTVNHVVNDNTETDSDDIQITIKIGRTLTNIFIKKKDNDVKVKLNTDQEVQTSQLMEKSMSFNTSPSAPKSAEINVQNIEINVGGEGVVSAVTEQTNTKESTINNNKVNLDKTVLTKKNTASDETITVEISPSLEKELTKIMQCDDNDNITTREKTQKITQTNRQDANKIQSDKGPTTQDIEIDEDLFASGSVKEGNVQLLKATKSAPSEVLMPTLKQNKKATQTQRQAEKRNRENDEDETSSKKLKVTSNVYDSIEDVPNEENKDESSINYDSVMGQVFASIDADMGNVEKSQSVINENQNKTLVDRQPVDTLVITQHSQFLKTQKTQRRVLGLSKMTNATQKVKTNLHQKDSESLFALSNVESQPAAEKGLNQKHGPETQAQVESLLTPGMCRDLAAGATSQDCADIPATPQDRDDSDMSVCEETPQKTSFTRKSNAGSNGSQQAKSGTQQSQLHPQETELIKEIIDISDTEPAIDKDATVVAKPKLTIETPTINQFCNSVQHNSTPVARKSLNFAADQPISSSVVANKNAQDVFPKPRTPQAVPKFCVAASCLTAAEVKAVERLCTRKNWTFVKEFTKELTHLVVGVDEEGRSQRTVKFMCALAAGKWIVRYEWADAWLRRGAADEEQFEALDWTGEPGPRRARTAASKLFEGFTFYCMPPFSVLSEPVLKVMLESAGGRVASEARAVRVEGEDVRVEGGDVRVEGGDVRVEGGDVRLLLAEPEHTQENQFTYLALELSIVPVNYEWALNCLGSYTLSSILELMLCPTSLLPAPAASWPAVLITQEFDAASDSD